MSKVKHTNKGCCTSCILLRLGLKLILRFHFIFLLNQRFYSHSIFALHVGCSTQVGKHLDLDT
jgi:hypothetical protein